MRNQILLYLFEQSKIEMVWFHPWKIDTVRSFHPKETQRNI